jgi:nucleoside-diphosphate-sugar epimerase
VAAEKQAVRFAAEGRRGVILRLGLLDGPGTASELPDLRYGATLHVDDAGQALADALELPSGVYNACRDAERVSNERLKRASTWRPTK